MGSRQPLAPDGRPQTPPGVKCSDTVRPVRSQPPTNSHVTGRELTPGGWTTLDRGHQPGMPIRDHVGTDLQEHADACSRCPEAERVATLRRRVGQPAGARHRPGVEDAALRPGRGTSQAPRYTRTRHVLVRPSRGIGWHQRPNRNQHGLRFGKTVAPGRCVLWRHLRVQQRRRATRRPRSGPVPKARLTPSSQPPRTTECTVARPRCADGSFDLSSPGCAGPSRAPPAALRCGPSGQDLHSGPRPEHREAVRGLHLRPTLRVGRLNSRRRGDQPSVDYSQSCASPRTCMRAVPTADRTASTTDRTICLIPSYRTSTAFLHGQSVGRKAVVRSHPEADGVFGSEACSRSATCGSARRERLRAVTSDPSASPPRRRRPRDPRRGRALPRGRRAPRDHCTRRRCDLARRNRWPLELESAYVAVGGCDVHHPA